MNATLPLVRRSEIQPPTTDEVRTILAAAVTADQLERFIEDFAAHLIGRQA